jgi:glutamate-1-semialdehyde 2,1-aminomutase
MALFGKFFHCMLAGAIYWPPAQFEAAFISAAHSDEDIQTTIEVVDKALSSTPH